MKHLSGVVSVRRLSEDRVLQNHHRVRRQNDGILRMKGGDGAGFVPAQTHDLLGGTQSRDQRLVRIRGLYGKVQADPLQKLPPSGGSGGQNKGFCLHLAEISVSDRLFHAPQVEPPGGYAGIKGAAPGVVLQDGVDLLVVFRGEVQPQGPQAQILKLAQAIGPV